LNPSGPAVGIVLFVVGMGIWVGVQHLGYHEFFEIRRVAQRTMDQKKIIINNLAIRRACERLARANSMEVIIAVLEQAFEASDFDGFELRVSPLASSSVFGVDAGSVRGMGYEWCRPLAHQAFPSKPADWNLTLDLLVHGGRRVGFFSVYRACNGKPLLADINLLAEEFRMALAAAVDHLIKAETPRLVGGREPQVAQA
jgi:hypothetical protein